MQDFDRDEQLLRQLIEPSEIQFHLVRHHVQDVSIEILEKVARAYEREYRWLSSRNDRPDYPISQPIEGLTMAVFSPFLERIQNGTVDLNMLKVAAPLRRLDPSKHTSDSRKLWETDVDSSPVLRQVKDRPSILLLEDDRELRETLAELLEEQEFSVLAYGRGEDAVQGAEYEQVDLLVTDIRMDGMDGLEAILSLRQIHPTLETLVISGYASESETLRALQLRVGAYLKKPFAANTFLQTVNRLLPRY